MRQEKYERIRTGLSEPDAPQMLLQLRNEFAVESLQLIAKANACTDLTEMRELGFQIGQRAVTIKAIERDLYFLMYPTPEGEDHGKQDSSTTGNGKLIC